MINNTFQILQWNPNGFYSKIDEIKLLINKFSPVALSIQETNFTINKTGSLKNYVTFFKNRDNHNRASGGVNLNLCKSIIFADDTHLYIRGTQISEMTRLLQKCLNDLSEWCFKVGFIFSPQKTKCILFSNKRKLTKPKLFLGTTRLTFVDDISILGLNFDTKLTWNSHIMALKKNTYKSLNVIKTLSHYEWGAEGTILLNVYRSLVRSKLDYGSICYGNSDSKILKIVDTIHNAGLRLSVGAFKSSPIISLLSLTGESPLHFRRLKLSLNYIARILSTPNNSTIHFLNKNRLSKIYEHNPKLRKPLGLKLQQEMMEINIVANEISQLNELIRVHSSSTSTQIYTDASKTEMGIGLAIVHLNETKHALANLQSIILSEPLALQISNLLSKSSKNIQFVWIPGHCNIKGNKKADEAARNAIISPNSELIPFSSLVDIKRNTNKYCVEWWNTKWHNTTENKLREIKHSVELWPKYIDLNRKNKVILNRLRIGHTKFTHGHLMAKTDPPLCPTCNINYSIKHIIVHCSNFNAARRDFNIPDNLYDAIGPFSNWRNTILYLKEIELYNSI
ncbi:Uncharacterized protein FWK35_00022234 [Aphis craccivora]|uniref:RNase H type-1 domain-containing protein n=1 Tax=Aphis craccivora TaxID=307492 RepID=A0A6G0Y451_APHCR|nr:Uncharacterized protein FWK35_00022234 [Aphis craccivora]